MTKLICLESTVFGDRFYSLCSDEEELKMKVGDTLSYPSGASYKILGFVDDIEDSESARKIIYPTQQEEDKALYKFINKMSQDYVNALYGKD